MIQSTLLAGSFAHKEDAYNVPLAQRSRRPNLEAQRSKAHQEVAKAPFSSVIRHKELGTEDSQANEELEIRAELVPRSQPQPCIWHEHRIDEGNESNSDETAIQKQENGQRLALRALLQYQPCAESSNQISSLQDLLLHCQQIYFQVSPGPPLQYR